MHIFIKYTGRFALAASLSFLASCSNSKTEPVSDHFEITDSLISKLLVDTVAPANKTTSLTFSAKITADEERKAEIFPMVSGTVQHVAVRSGDKVSKGQVLASVISAEMAGYDKEVISSAAELNNAERNLIQARDLYKSGLSSARELKDAENDFLIKQAENKRAKATLKLNGGNNNGLYTIKSPLNGVIIEKNVTSSMQLRPDNDNSLFTIADLSNVWALINIYESDISGISPGDIVDLSVLSYPNKTFQGSIEKVYNQLDDESKVMNARVNIQNPGQLLKPGMMATAKVAAKSGTDLPVINSRGIIFDDNKHYVLVLNANDKISIRPVEIWRKVADKVYISKGLQAGERIIASKQVFLYESLKN